MTKRLPEALKGLPSGAKIHGTLTVSVSDGTVCQIHVNNHNGYYGQVTINRTIGTAEGADALSSAAKASIKVRDVLVSLLNEEGQ